MKAIEFNQSTKVSKGVNGNVDLHYWSDGTQCVSCWQPTLKERLSILVNGKVWLGVKSGRTQPPIFVSGQSVFNKLKWYDQIKWCVVNMYNSLLKALKLSLNDNE